MPKLPLPDPSHPPSLPFWAGLRVRLRVLWERRLSPRTALRLAYLSRRIELWVNPRRRRQMAALMKPLLPPGTSRRELSRQVVLSRAIRRVGTHSLAPIAARSRQWLLEALQPEGLETLEAIRQAGRGAVILGSHAGLNSWVGSILLRMGYPLRLMQRRAISPQRLLLLRANGWVERVLPYPPPGQEGLHLKRLCELVCQGQWIQHVADFPDSRAGVLGALLGRPVRCCRAPWVIGRLTGTPLIPAVVLVDERKCPRLVIGPAIHVAEDGPAAGAIAPAFQTYLDFLNAHLAKRPWNLSVLDWEGTTAAPGSLD